MKTIKQTLDEAPEDITVPYNVWRFFGSSKKTVDFAGDQASLGEDFGTLGELRDAVKWYVEQLGGTVKWK